MTSYTVKIPRKTTFAKIFKFFSVFHTTVLTMFLFGGGIIGLAVGAVVAFGGYVWIKRS